MANNPSDLVVRLSNPFGSLDPQALSKALKRFDFDHADVVRHITDFVRRAYRPHGTTTSVQSFKHPMDDNREITVLLNKRRLLFTLEYDDTKLRQDNMQRVTVYLSKEHRERLSALVDEQRISNNQFIRKLLVDSIDKPRRPLEIKSKKQIIFYSKSLIEAMQEALSYDVKRHHNRPPPALWVDKPEYLVELRHLVAELRKLNKLLEAPKTKQTNKHVIEVAKHFNHFLHNYAGVMGKGAAALTIAVVAALLVQSGLAGGATTTMLKHIK